MKNISLCMLLLLTVFAVEAQEKSTDNAPKFNKWSIMFEVGSPQFYGDLRQYDFWTTPSTSDKSVSERGSFAFGVSLNKQVSHLFSVGLNFQKGDLKGTKYRLYKSYFTNDFHQISLTAGINLKTLLLGETKLPRWKWDLYTGVGIVRYHAQSYEIGTGKLQRFTNYEALNAFEKQQADQYAATSGGSGMFTNDVVVPVGLNLQYEVSPRIDLGLTMCLNNANSEKLDATIGNDFSTIANGGNNITRRGTSALDKWAFLSLGITVKLGKNAVKKYINIRPDALLGTYHLRWLDPKFLLKQPRILTIEQVDSVAKANRPQDIDPRLLTDIDGDGVSDYFDKQNQTPPGSIVTGAGVAIDFKQYVTTITSQNCNEVFANILFETNQSIVTAGYYDVLNKMVALLNNSSCRLQLSGHADKRSYNRHNMQLSQKRVQSVKQYLVNAGVNNPNKILTDAFGSFKPIADNTTPEGQKRNRRVEIRLVR